MKINPPDFSGKTVACIASGPSLTSYDCHTVWVSGVKTVAVNTSIRMAPWADVMYAGDIAWWREYAEDVARFPGLKYSFNSLAREFGAIPLADVPWFANPGNSGAGAISLAMAGGAKKIVLLGYDCSIKSGTHWHGNHGGTLSNCQSINRWPAQFAAIEDDAKERGIKIINASADTELRCFERATLADALWEDLR